MRDSPRVRWLGFLVLLLLASPLASAAPYQGSDSCQPCHPQQYSDWKVSGHPYKLMRSEEARIRPLPLPEGYSWDDISYVIGGYKWKSRYIGQDGFILTSILRDGQTVPGLTQYNLMTGRWVDYHAGQTKAYDCGKCHTTGYSPDGHQDGRPGLVGTWAFGGIHCEACHGAGHEKRIDRSAAACGQCHVRGETNTIPASGGFIRHHEQYNEFLASPHAGLDCVSCHNPHRKAGFSIVRTCENCHPSQAASFDATPMQVAGVTCIDCHMAKAAKSAEARGPHEGDVHSHLFRIDWHASAQMFTDDGGFVNLGPAGQGALTLDFACQRCHADRSLAWLEQRAFLFHERAPDLDGDGVSDDFDNCPQIANGVDEDNQADADGDGIGDACEWGDVTCDGIVNTTDARLIQRVSVGAIPKDALCRNAAP